MNEEINDLISYYDEEKTKLEELINECILDSDYKYAYLFQKGVAIVNNQLNILKSLKDPNYPKKRELEGRIKFFDKIRLNSPQISDYINEQIKQTEIKLDSLNNHKPSPFYDGQEFDDVIFNLVEGKIHSFIFHLKKELNLYLKFEQKNAKLVISITPDQQMGTEIYFPKSRKRFLKAMGFKRNKTKEYFKLKYPLSLFKDSIPIKTIVSRVIYDVFFINELDSETTLEIHY